MITKVNITSIYECSLERVFKTPMLCDVSKIHTGFGIMPKVTHTTDHKDWGKPGSCKKVYVAKSITQKGGFASVDNLIERKENQYWIIQVDNFQSWMLSFYKFVSVKRSLPGPLDSLHLFSHQCRLRLQYTSSKIPSCLTNFNQVVVPTTVGTITRPWYYYITFRFREIRWGICSDLIVPDILWSYWEMRY